MRIRTADMPPTGIGWASQPSRLTTVAALFPDQPWVWADARAPYWQDVDREWIVVTDLALMSEPPVHPRWVGGFVRAGVGAGLWQILPAGTRLRFVRRNVGTDHQLTDAASLSLAWGRGLTLRCAVAEHNRRPEQQPPLWALLATALIAPAVDPLSRGLAAPEPIIEAARAAAAEALAAIHSLPDPMPVPA